MSDNQTSAWTARLLHAMVLGIVKRIVDRFVAIRESETVALLIAYVLIALIFSFLCSVAEAVILSTTPSYIALLEKERRPLAGVLRKLKEDISKPLAAILTLNTVAHTVGAVGAGAQAAAVFGSAFVGVASAVLTFLILVFSEIIPKTLGAHYWRSLAPATAYGLKFLVWVMYPFVKMSELITRSFSKGQAAKGVSRREFAAIADLGAEEGELDPHELEILKNLMLLRNSRVRDAMTPRTVVFSLPEEMRIEEFFRSHESAHFSRIPLYRDEPDHITGFVLRNDILLAQAKGDTNNTLKQYRRKIPVLLDSMTLVQALNEFQTQHAHIVAVMDEYGSMEGILTLEDFLESLLGQEIVDESDKTENMQQLARDLWRLRAGEIGVDIDEPNKS